MIKIISAGAGSGKTYRLTEELFELLSTGCRAQGIIATTFTTKAAAELQERVRVKLLEKNCMQAAEEVSQALIGTVHSIGTRLLQRFAFEIGVSPDVEIIADEDQQLFFNQSLATVLQEDRVQKMEELCSRFGLESDTGFSAYDWRKELKDITEQARSNDFSTTDLQISAQKSMENFWAAIPENGNLTPVQTWHGHVSTRNLNTALQHLITDTINRLDLEKDTTKTTAEAVAVLQEALRVLRVQGFLTWPTWAKLSKLKPGAKSKEEFAELLLFTTQHIHHPDFRKDITDFTNLLFELAADALQEYAAFKRNRGLIDLIDMETLVNTLLTIPMVQETLRQELDVLIVDEFQDTSPIQLSIFLKLAGLAKNAIWVGDPKQSIYGFRGAEPALMEGIIQYFGGIKPENILRHSWRSREDLVHASNAIFTTAFSQTPPDLVSLQPKRQKKACTDSVNRTDEPQDCQPALQQWHLRPETEEKRPPKTSWQNRALAESLRARLEQGVLVHPKGKKEYRLALPGDVAILCRTNRDCQDMAAALEEAGLKAAVSQNGLLATAEARLLIACLKYLLHPSDSLSVAEILLLGEGETITTILEHRMAFLESGSMLSRWALEYPMIQKLQSLRPQSVSLSCSEIVHVVMDELELARLVSRWSKQAKRLANLEAIRLWAGQYEDKCNRLHTAASLGGFILWLVELEQKDKDTQEVVTNEQTVQVLTYHRSKGLEWPIVLCKNLDHSEKSRLWGQSLVNDQTTLNISNILSDRWIRYWVNPYGSQWQNTPLVQYLEATHLVLYNKVLGVGEKARLLYVGFTRPRDYLIIPTFSGSYQTSWLNSVWNGSEEIPTLDAENPISPWEWNGTVVPKETLHFQYPDEFESASIKREDEQSGYWEPRRGKGDFLAKWLDLRIEKPSTLPQSAVCTPPGLVVWGDAIPITDESRRLPVGNVVKNFLGAWKTRTDCQELAMELTKNDSLVSPEQLLGLASQLDVFMQQHTSPGSNISFQYPLLCQWEDRLFKTQLDEWAMASNQNHVVHQFSRYVGDDRACKQHAMNELSQWATLVRAELEKQTGGKTQIWVHFVLIGKSLSF